MSAETVATSELTIDHIQRALSPDIDEPQTAQWIAGKLPKSVRVTAADVLAVFEARDDGDGVHRFELAKGAKFWHSSPGDYVRRKLLEKARSGPLSKAKVCGDTAKLAVIKSLMTRRAVEQMFDRLVSEQAIQTCPAVIGGRSRLFIVGKSDPAFYVRDAMAKLKQRLQLAPEDLIRVLEETQAEQRAALEIPSSSAESSGGTPAPVNLEPPVAAGPPDERILIALRELEPRFDEGELVSLAKLRERLELSFQTPESFDVAVLNLVSRRILTVHPYDHPMTEADRQSFVRDERGTWYNVISKRI